MRYYKTQHWLNAIKRLKQELLERRLFPQEDDHSLHTVGTSGGRHALMDVPQEEWESIQIWSLDALVLFILGDVNAAAFQQMVYRYSQEVGISYSRQRRTLDNKPSSLGELYHLGGLSVVVNLLHRLAERMRYRCVIEKIPARQEPKNAKRPTTYADLRRAVMPEIRELQNGI